MRTPLFAALSLVTLVPGLGYSAEEASPAKPVSIEELEKKGALIGRLGLPFGTIVRATCRGIVPTEQDLSTKAQEWKDQVEVVAVNGKPLLSAQRLEWSVFENEGAPAKPAAGKSVVISGYESGSFEGLPDGLGDYVDLPASTGFQFNCRFVALRVEKDASKEK